MARPQRRRWDKARLVSNDPERDPLAAFGYTDVGLHGVRLHSFAIAEAKDTETLQPVVVAVLRSADKSQPNTGLAYRMTPGDARSLAAALVEWAEVADARHWT
jgi:hypothetical protein